MSVVINSDNTELTTTKDSKITAADYKSIADFYAKWFTVTYTPPASNTQITAADFNALRSAILTGAGTAWSIAAFPAEVAAKTRIVSTTWNAPVANNKTLDLTISANVQGVDLRTLFINAGWDTSVPLIGSVTVAPNVIVGAPNTGSYAMTIVGPFPDGSKITLINDGYIVGAGGNGANDYHNGWGHPGGPAIHAAYAVTIVNNAVIGGGGGGGGAGTMYAGGGGAGNPSGAGYALVNGPIHAGGSAAWGSLMNGGNGQYAANQASGYGGNAGYNGGNYSGVIFYAGGGGGLGGWGGSGGNGGGGAPGACVDGNSFVTWTPTTSSQIYGALNN